jgi:C4-dicarboxylate-specific signal transduction histidine kinase
MRQPDTDNRQVAFFGRMTAGITHEMKNVLAIIKESSGLMQDILSFSNEAAFRHEDKFKDALQTINGQIERGAELTSRLNRFAHYPDDVTQSVDLNDLVVHLVALSTRFARLKKIDLVFMPSGAVFSVRTRPISLQMALFAGIECCFAAMPSGGRIDIRIDTETGEKRITIGCHGKGPVDGSFSKPLTQGHQWKLFIDGIDDIAGRHELNAPLRRLSVFLPEAINTESGKPDVSNDK